MGKHFFEIAEAVFPFSTFPFFLLLHWVWHDFAFSLRN